MKIRIHNNDDTDSVVYEAETLEEIKKIASERIKLPTWDKGWSEEIKMKAPTKNEIIEYMKSYNADEVGLDNPINFEEAEYLLSKSDKYNEQN